MKIGIAGTGRMGSAIATRLLGLGHEVTVWNRSPEKTAPLAAAGAKVAATPAAVAGGVEAVITILSDAAAIDAAYNGPDGLLAGDAQGKVFIEMSTVRPAIQQALDKQVRAKGAALVECPVGGTTGPARDGKLLGFVGGADADVARVRPLLESLCRRVEHVGPIGAGASMKLAINLPLMVFWQSFGEALSLVKPLGIEPARLMDIFADTSGGPNLLKTRGPMIAQALEGKGTGPVTSDVDLARKDLRTMLAEAESLGVTLPAARAALECFDAAAKDGLGSSDAMTLPAHWIKRGGT